MVDIASPHCQHLNSVLQEGFLKPSEPEAVGWGPVSTTLTQPGLRSLRADSILHNLGVIQIAALTILLYGEHIQPSLLVM